MMNSDRLFAWLTRNRDALWLQPLLGAGALAALTALRVPVIILFALGGLPLAQLALAAGTAILIAAIGGAAGGAVFRLMNAGFHPRRPGTQVLAFIPCSLAYLGTTMPLTDWLAGSPSIRASTWPFDLFAALGTGLLISLVAGPLLFSLQAFSSPPPYKPLRKPEAPPPPSPPPVDPAQLQLLEPPSQNDPS